MKSKKNTRTYSVDWGHKKKNAAWYDVDKTKHLDVTPKLKKGDIVIGENFPTYQAKELYGKGVVLLTCHTMATKEHRDELGIPHLRHFEHEGHKDDAFVAADIYKNKPKLFYQWKPNIIKLLYSTFMQIQKARVAATLREWSIEAKENDNHTIEFLKKAEEEAIKATDIEGKGMIVYDYVRAVPYLGPRTGAGLVALADSTKFETASKLRRQAGLSVIDGGVQRFIAGKSSGYNPDLKALLIKRIGDGIIKSSGKPTVCAYFLDYSNEKTRLKKLPSLEVSIDDEHRIVGDLLAESVSGFERGKRVYKHMYPKLKKELKKQGKKTVLIKLSDGHIHSRAIRKAVQLLLEDYWVISRQLQGFSTVPPYAISVAKHVHYRKPRYIPKILEPFDPMRDTGWIFTEGKRPWNQACEYIREKCGR